MYIYTVLYESAVQEELLIGSESTEDAEISGQGVNDGRTESPHCSQYFLTVLHILYELITSNNYTSFKKNNVNLNHSAPDVILL